MEYIEKEKRKQEKHQKKSKELEGQAQLLKVDKEEMFTLT